MDGSERVVWEASWTWAVGRREGEGQPRRRLMRVCWGVVVIARGPSTARCDFKRVLNERNEAVLGKSMIASEGSQMKNFLRFIASLLLTRTP